MKTIKELWAMAQAHPKKAIGVTVAIVLFVILVS
jgi:hypothetical protein|tara:strand:+ start:914 stop:1015 length:102 start_codon:yes stop_codon:yes gene_type:complete